MALEKKENAIELQGITKTFGSVVANDHINPVSYTHLDVYKRQALCRANRDSNPSQYGIQ